MKSRRAATTMKIIMNGGENRGNKIILIDLFQKQNDSSS